jgi:2-polyprenyl-3-methyl-5-hydroxy-6-metoxy-1,4-benzoquinol methylase
MSTDHNIQFDQTKSEQFAEKMMTILNYGALNLMTSIGYRTGLFDVMSELPPATSEHIAKSAGLNERYVREWLGAMVTGGIIEYDPEKNTYALPREHAAWLTRKASPNNIAITTQWLAVLGTVEDKIVDCFKNGGGVGYEHFNRFHEVMADESRQTVLIPLFEQLLPLVPALTEKLEQGIEVLDVGCGSGFALIEMAKEFPKSRFTGYDMSSEAIQSGRKKTREYGLKNIELERRDVANFNTKQKYDLITTFDAVHDQAYPDRLLTNIFAALKDDGVYFMQDIAGSSQVQQNMEHPIAPFLYTISCMHCMTVSLSQNGKGLGAMWGK